MKLDKLTREEFEQMIVDDWAAYFACLPGEFGKSGSSYIPRENYAADRVIIAHVGSRTFVQYHPGLEGKILAFARQCPIDLAMTADHFISYFENTRVQIEVLDEMFYLYPPDLTPFTPHERFTVQKLSAQDEAALDALNNACTEEEVDNSFVAVDELGAWGCFADGKLAAAAAFSDWGLYGDFGVITHPQFRKQGLAKAVVSAACKDAVGMGKIPIYRCHITLFASINTAKALGFRKHPGAYFKMEVLKFVD